MKFMAFMHGLTARVSPAPQEDVPPREEALVLALAELVDHVSSVCVGGFVSFPFLVAVPLCPLELSGIWL